MPSELVRSGRDFINKKGEAISPQAIVHRCEDCGAPNAPFGLSVKGELFTYCGYVDGEPRCVNRDEREA